MKLKNRGLVYGAAIVLDGIDYVGVGFVTILGDVIDIISIPIMYKLLGNNLLAVLGAVELVPLADIFPSNTLLALIVDFDLFGVAKKK